MRVTQTTLETVEQQDIYVFKVCREGDSQKFLLQPAKTADEEIQPFDNVAVLNRESSGILSHIASLCTFEAYSVIEPWISITNGTAMIEKDTCILVDVVIYGRREHCQDVSDILDIKRVYLQEPDYRNTHLGYKNPHFMDLSSLHLGSNADLDPLSSYLLQADVNFQQLQISSQQVMTQTLLKQKVAAAFKTMTRAQNLKRITADIRVRTHLLP